jgi:hypothetical protein
MIFTLCAHAQQGVKQSVYLSVYRQSVEIVVKLAAVDLSVSAEMQLYAYRRPLPA